MKTRNSGEPSTVKRSPAIPSAIGCRAATAQQTVAASTADGSGAEQGSGHLPSVLLGEFFCELNPLALWRVLLIRTPVRSGLLREPQLFVGHREIEVGVGVEGV